MKNLFYFLPVAGALTGFLTALSGIALQKCLLRKEDMSTLLDKQLDNLISTFQQEIPMAAMFLKGKLLEKIKSRSEEELLKVFPELKEKMIKKISIKFLILGTIVGTVVGIILSLI